MNIQAGLLKDFEWWQTLQSNGYVLLDAGLEAETELIQEFISKHFSLPDSKFYYSLIDNDFHQNQNIRNTLSKILLPFYELYFQNYRTITESFLAKPAYTKDELLLHQDWCYTDESKFNAYNIWIPLTDVDENNGAMFFLPGSHRWFHNYRSGTLPTARISMTEVDTVKIVCMKRGQALVFHPAVFHGSFPNHSQKNRIVTTATVMEKNAPFLYYHRENENQVVAIEMEDEALLGGLEKIAMGSPPQGAHIHTFSYRHQIITAADLKAKQAI